jgi:glycosyltransferase involved in cell wall biosynthesis
MKIGIDITPLYDKKLTGIGYTIYNLIKYLAKIDTNNQYILFSYGSFFKNRDKGRLEILKSRIPQQKNFKLVFFRFPSNLKFINERFIPLNILIGKVDIFHVPYQLYCPFIVGGKKIFTIHDIIPFINPQWDTNPLRFKRVMALIFKRANKIITISESSKNDLIKYCNIFPDRITIIPNGVDPHFKLIEQKIKQQILLKYNLTNNYIFYTGEVVPRKNLTALLKAFESLIKNKIYNHKLVISGIIHKNYTEFFDTLNNMPISVKENIIITGYVPYEDLPALYNGAEILVFPSLYEGFGLPVLEAMACGCPVITSNVSSLPEVCGDAAILINPDNVDEITDAMERVLSDGKLREEMKRKGLKRAKMFSWEKAARETLQVYYQATNISK